LASLLYSLVLNGFAIKQRVDIKTIWSFGQTKLILKKWAVLWYEPKLSDGKVMVCDGQGCDPYWKALAHSLLKAQVAIALRTSFHILFSHRLKLSLSGFSEDLVLQFKIQLILSSHSRCPLSWVFSSKKGCLMQSNQ
jgi:hypothetical protein